MISANRLTTKTIFHHKWMLLCFFVVFFQPLMLWDRIPFNFFFRALQLLMWITIFIVQLSRLQKWNLYLWVWTAFCCIQVIVILNNSGYTDANPEKALETILSYLFLVHFLDLFFKRSGRKEVVFLWKYLFAMLMLELISVPLYHLGAISIYWLGIKTRATEAIVAFLLINLILKGHIKKSWFCSGIILSIVIVLILKISTAVIGMALIAGCWWLLKKPHLKWFLKLLQSSAIISVTLVLTVGVLFFDIQTRFSDIFSFAFSKDITFSGRVELWENGITKLALYDGIHHLWGYGFSNIPLWTGWKYFDITTEAHNQLLQMLHDTGLIGTIILYVTWFLQMHEMKKCSNQDVRNIIASTCFACFIMCITEIFCYHSYFYIVLAIAARSGDIVKNLNLHQFKWRKET